VTHLRKMMLEELQRRNYAETTIDSYIRAVEDFSRYFNCSPDRLGPRHIREYQAALFQKRKFSPNTVSQHLAALRFFYVKTLKKAWSITETPYPKKAVHLPTILSQEEVARLIDAALTPYHRALLMTLTRRVLAPLPVASAPRRVRAHPELRLPGQSQTCHQLATLLSVARRSCNSADRTRQVRRQQRE
jgi:site-specific recombinase XerD